MNGKLPAPGNKQTIDWSDPVPCQQTISTQQDPSAPIYAILLLFQLDAACFQTLTGTNIYLFTTSQNSALLFQVRRKRGVQWHAGSTPIPKTYRFGSYLSRHLGNENTCPCTWAVRLAGSRTQTFEFLVTKSGMLSKGNKGWMLTTSQFCLRGKAAFKVSMLGRPIC